MTFTLKVTLLTLLLATLTRAEEYETYEDANKKVNCMMPISMVPSTCWRRFVRFFHFIREFAEMLHNDHEC